MRRAAKRDDNEALIVRALQSAGWTVFRVSDTGLPDLMCARDGKVILLEVKAPDGTLTPAQRETFTELAKAGVMVQVVRSPQEALEVLGSYLGTSQGKCYLAADGSFLCTKCWIPEDGLHAKDCPTRKALAKPPKVTSAYRAAKTLEEALPRRHVTTAQVKAALEEMRDECDCVRMKPFPPPLRGMRFVADENCKRCLGRATRRPSHGVEGELQPLPRRKS